MIEPISPDSVQGAANKSIPDFVVQAFNELIAKNWDGKRATVHQSAVVEKAIDIQTQQYKEKHQTSDWYIPAFNYDWLNIEPLYEAKGWKVEYDKPGYCETYPATFKFTK